ncbi:MAG: saccharopine dehydrogenase NADP-binding domain-containing protein [Acidiferrobacterales bacterium]
MSIDRKKIIVLGGYGAVGSQICAAVARIPYVECVIAGRHPRRARRLAKSISASTLCIDINVAEQVERELADAFLVINAAAPFQQQQLTVAQFCANTGVHYIDIADDRSYVNNVLGLSAQAKRSGSVLVTGVSSMPAIAAVLVDSLSDYFDKINEIQTTVAGGNKAPFGRASVYSLLSKIGGTVRSKHRGRWREVSCWTKPRVVSFPPPVGRRRAYLYDVPALDEFSRTYAVQTATFRMGLQVGLFNRALGLLGWLHRIGRLKRPARYTGLLHLLSRRFRKRGDASYAIQAQVSGSQGGEEVNHSIALVEAESGGMGIITSVVITLVKRWVEHGVSETGAYSAVGYVSLDDIRPELIDHDVKLVRS